jgi:hypothetical protein
MQNAYKILVANPEGKRPLGRPRYGWADNIKMDPTYVRVWIQFNWLRIGPVNRLL